MTNPNNNSNKKKSPSESDIYDRQIRLWGAEAQAKMSKARVLYLNITGVSSEILKNLVLAGVAATICDNRSLSEVADTPSFFLPPSLFTNNDDGDDGNNGDGSSDEQTTSNKKTKYATVADAVQPLIEELNPLLGKCPTVTKQVSEFTQDDLKEYSVVVASRMTNIEDTIKLSKMVVENNNGGKFYMADCFGMNGCCIIDLGPNCEYRPEQGKKLLDPTSAYKPNAVRPYPYVSFDKLWNVPIHQAINRFHKTPPPVWIQYRCLLQYIKEKHTWPSPSGSGSGNETDDFTEIIQDWLVNNNTDEQKHEMLSVETLNDLATIATADVAPVCAVLGGIIGNEIIKVISGKGEPATNTLLMDGTTCKVMTFLVQPTKK